MSSLELYWRVSALVADANHVDFFMSNADDVLNIYHQFALPESVDIYVQRRSNEIKQRFIFSGIGHNNIKTSIFWHCAIDIYDI